MFFNNNQVTCDYYYHSDQYRDEEREYKENLESTRITLSLLAVSDVACVQECNNEVNTPCPYDAITTTNVPAQASSPPRILTPAVTNIQNNNIPIQKPPQTNSKFAQFMAKKKAPYVAEVPTYAHLPSSPTTPTITDTYAQESNQALSLPHKVEEEEDKENITHNYDPPSLSSPKGSPNRYSTSRPRRLSSSSTANDASLVHVTDVNTINEALLSLRLSLTPRRRRSSSHEPTPMSSPIPVHLPYTPLNAPSTTTSSVKTRSASQIPRWTPTPGPSSLTPAKTATPLTQLHKTPLNSSTNKSNTKATGIPKRILPSHTSYTPSTPTPVRTATTSMASATRSGLRYNTATNNGNIKGAKRAGLNTNTPVSTTPAVTEASVTKAIVRSVKRAISRPQPRTTDKTPTPAAIVKKGQNYDSPSGAPAKVTALVKRRLA